MKMTLKSIDGLLLTGVYGRMTQRRRIDSEFSALSDAGAFGESETRYEITMGSGASAFYCVAAEARGSVRGDRFLMNPGTYAVFEVDSRSDAGDFHELLKLRGLSGATLPNGERHHVLCFRGKRWSRDGFYEVWLPVADRAALVSA